MPAGPANPGAMSASGMMPSRCEVSSSIYCQGDSSKGPLVAGHMPNAYGLFDHAWVRRWILGKWWRVTVFRRSPCSTRDCRPRPPTGFCAPGWCLLFACRGCRSAQRN